MANKKKRRAIIFDRDGVLNEDTGYVSTWKTFCWMKGAPEAIRLANKKGYLVGVVTNQSGVARGYFNEKAVKILHIRMNKELSKMGAHINRFEYCPFHPEGTIPRYKQTSLRRKPAPGMLISCMKAWKLRPEDCIVIGDQESDLVAAKSVNIKGYKFEGGSLLEFIKPLLQD